MTENFPRKVLFQNLELLALVIGNVGTFSNDGNSQFFHLEADRKAIPACIFYGSDFRFSFNKLVSNIFQKTAFITPFESR